MQVHLRFIHQQFKMKLYLFVYLQHMNFELKYYQVFSFNQFLKKINQKV